MAKYRFYIVDVEIGEVSGTNSEDIAYSYRGSMEHFVIDSKNDIVVNEDDEEDIEEIKKVYNNLAYEGDEDED